MLFKFKILILRQAKMLIRLMCVCVYIYIYIYIFFFFFFFPPFLRTNPTGTSTYVLIHIIVELGLSFCKTLATVVTG